MVVSPDRYRDLLYNVLANHINIVHELGRDGQDRRAVGDGALDELLDRLMLVNGGALIDQINLVLENNNVLDEEHEDTGQ